MTTKHARSCTSGLPAADFIDRIVPAHSHLEIAAFDTLQDPDKSVQSNCGRAREQPDDDERSLDLTVEPLICS